MLFPKPNRPGFSGSSKVWLTGTIAGLAGGAAEVSWIAIYANLSGSQAATVARGITQTVFPLLVAPEAAIPLGIAIHMGLAIALGIAISILVRTHLAPSLPAVFEPVAVVGLLVGIWFFPHITDDQPCLRHPGSLHHQPDLQDTVWSRRSAGIQAYGQPCACL